MKMRSRIVSAAVVAAFAAQGYSISAEGKGSGARDLAVTSPSFRDGGTIPEVHSYAAGNVSPSIWWDNCPKGAVTVAMICDDPDAPSGDWIHWVIFNVPAASGLVSEGLPHGEVLPSGVLQGVNDFGNIGYDGPAPPSGTHRYYFRVFALDARLDTKPGATAGELYAAMEGHVLAKGSIMGRYKSKLTARTGL